MGRRWQEVLAGGLGALVVVAALVIFVQLHAATADWWPKPVPTRVQFDKRNFVCGNAPYALDVDQVRGLVPRGRTIGGGTIYAPPGDRLPSGIAVRDGSTYYSCSLSGSP